MLTKQEHNRILELNTQLETLYVDSIKDAFKFVTISAVLIGVLGWCISVNYDAFIDTMRLLHAMLAGGMVFVMFTQRGDLMRHRKSQNEYLVAYEKYMENAPKA